MIQRNFSKNLHRINLLGEYSSKFIGIILHPIFKINTDEFWLKKKKFFITFTKTDLFILGMTKK